MRENNFTNDDLISNLPLELIYKIISALPFASAARMRLLSRQWHGLWDKVLVRHGSIDDLLSAIASFLEHIDDCNPVMHPWKLYYQFGTKSFVLATILGNFQLQLDFSKFSENSTSFFHLSIKPSISLPDTPCSPPISPSNFYVKILHLKAVSYMSMATIASLATNFQFVESLCIEECKGLHSLHVAGPELKKLTILRCFELSTLHMNTPKLERFYFKGYRPWILAKGLEYKLKDVLLDFRRGARSKHLGCSPALLLSSLTNVSRATICRWSYQEIIASEQYRNYSENFKLHQLKELRWIERKIDGQTIRMLISFLSLSPSIEKLFITIDPRSCKFPSMARHVSGNKTRLFNLKVVEIEGCNNEMEETLLVGALLSAATSHPIIISKNITQQKFPKVQCSLKIDDLSISSYVVDSNFYERFQVDQGSSGS